MAVSDIDELLKQGSIDENEDEEFQESSTETQEEETEEGAGSDQTEDDEVTFDKSKTQERFQVLTQHNKELKEKLEEMEQWKAEVETKLSSNEEQQEEAEIPEWFSEVMGDNEKAWKGFLGLSEKMKIEAIEAIKRENEEQQEQETKASQAGVDWVNSQLELVEETHGELTSSKRNELMAVVEKYTPTDEDGNLDFIKGYQLMQVLSKKTTDTARKIISDTSGSSRTVDTEDFKGKVVTY